MKEELIGRLETAEVGSRELDVLIWTVFDAAKIERDISRHKGTWPRGASNDEKAARRASYLKASAPGFTTSLDAALALAERVLPGWWPAFAKTSPVAWSADVYEPTSHASQSVGQAASGPLALCIAILRATPNAGMDQ